MKPIPNTSVKYSITSHGRVYSHVSNKFNKTQINKEGYRWVTLHNSGNKITFNVHRMVAELYVPNPHNKEMVNHKDGNRLNNHVDNLEWVTRSENSEHGKSNGNVLDGRKKRVSLSEDDWMDIYNAYLTGAFSMSEIANGYNASLSCISKGIKRYRQNLSAS